MLFLCHDARVLLVVIAADMRCVVVVEVSEELDGQDGWVEGLVVGEEVLLNHAAYFHL